MHKPLTKKQYDFCAAYIQNGFNAYEAAISAGYSECYAYSRAHKLTEQPLIKKSIADAYHTTAKKLGITFEWKVKKLESIINFFMETSGKPLSPQNAKAVVQAIAELNRMQGDLSPRKQLTVNIDATYERLNEARKAYKEF